MRLTTNAIQTFVHHTAPRSHVTRHHPVIVVHGFQDAGSSFDEVAGLLADVGYDVYCPDLRGFGDSDRIAPGGYYHFLDYIFDLADLVDQIAPEQQVHLVGHSMGGTVATLFAGTYPKRLCSLALLEGLGPLESPDNLAPDRVRHWIDGVRAMRERVERGFDLDEAAKRLSLNHPKVSPLVLRGRAEQLSKPIDINNPIGPRAWKFDPLHRTTSPIGFSVARFLAHVRHITSPTLVLDGGPTGFHPPDEAERIAILAKATAVTQVSLEHAGHMMQWTNPQGLAQALQTHFASTDTSHVS